VRWVHRRDDADLGERGNVASVEHLRVLDRCRPFLAKRPSFMTASTKSSASRFARRQIAWMSAWNPASSLPR